MRQRPHFRPVQWWLPVSLISRLKRYQHARQLDSLTAAARELLERSLDQEDNS
ncbi:MAG: hypothetical protein M0Z53_08485 [Thermaerobacter sp.]|nr:hypothetical protein [Thermaerobacter sp.]